MDQIYHEIYTDLYEAYSRRLGFPREPSERLFWYGSTSEVSRALTKIRKAIDSYAETHEDFRIRPDAKYFLVVNFFEVIVLPILIARGSIDTDPLLEEVDNDIRLILSEAPQDTSAETDEGITSHSILRSINNVWDRLRVTDSLHWMK